MTETTRMTFGDMFRNSFLNMFPETIDPWSLVTVLAVSLLLGLGIFLVYRHCFIGVVYDHSFNISLVVMTILTAVIIVTISSNVMLSLGMVGALSIVRYRTAVKNPLDLMFLFWAITSGIAIGAQYLSIMGVAYFICGIMQSYQNVIRGSGDVNTCVVAGITELCGRVMFAYLLAAVLGVGVTGIWIATPLSWGCGCIVPVVRYYTGKWKGKAIVTKE